MPLVTFRRNDQLGEIVIDSPSLNLFSEDLLVDLGAAADDAADSDIRAMLLRAEGSDFCAGAEVSIFVGLDAARAADLESTLLSLIGATEDVSVPTLALIHGQCYGLATPGSRAVDLVAR